MKDTKSNRKKLSSAIKQAFADTHYPGDDNLLRNLTHYEADELMQDFLGKRWEDVTVEKAYFHRQSLVLFTEEAFRYYLPGFLIAALQASPGPNYGANDVLESIFCRLIGIGYNESYKASLRSTIHNFTPEQKSSIEEFIKLFLDGESSIWIEGYIENVKEYWGHLLP